MTIIFNTLLVLGFIYALFRFARFIRYKKIERAVRVAHQDGWKLIEQANESLAQPIDMSVLKIINPDLYSEIKLRERMRKDRINAQKSNVRYNLQQAGLNLKRAMSACVIGMIVILAGCTTKPVDNMLCTYNDDPIMESKVRQYYSELADQDIKDKYNARCSEKLQKDSSTRAVTISGTIRYIENTVATGTTTGF